MLRACSIVGFVTQIRLPIFVTEIASSQSTALPNQIFDYQRPQAHRVVSTRCRQQLAIGAEGHAIDRTCMAPQDALRGSVVESPSAHRRTVLSALAVASQLPIGTEGHTIDRICMAPQDARLRRRIAERPQAHRLVSTRRRQQLAIGTEGHAIDRICMAPQERGSAVESPSAHRRTVLSALAVASTWPSGLKATP